MKWTSAFITTFREDPSDAELISHKLMIRAGLIRKLSTGIYTYLPLGWRAIQKVENIVREEMNAKNAVELHMPIICPSDIWKKTGRWDAFGESLWKIKDRNKNEFCLGPTHEEVITDLVRAEVQSYKNLPINLYQIQTKIRDEVRPRFGLMRAREFIMKDAYSFHTSFECLAKTYQDMYDAYSKIFTRCGLNFKVVEADSGAIGGSLSQEFMVLAQSGEDYIANCTKCDYVANVEKAESLPLHVSTETNSDSISTVDTPNIRTIAQLEEFFKIKPYSFIKTLLYIVESKPVAVLIRGDYEVCEAKLKNQFSGKDIRLASDDEVKTIAGCEVGFIGPVNLKDVTIIADHSVKTIKNGITGANQNDKHLKGVLLDRDFKAEKFADIKVAKQGDKCIKCGESIEIIKGIETGHIFQLGTKYSGSIGATFLDEKMLSHPCIMGCYGIGVTRIVAAAIEQNNDNDGMIWPSAIAPYQVVVTNIDTKSPEVSKVADQIYSDLLKRNIDAILDDRDERPGVKFKDADLIGFPLRINVGARGLKEGMVEIRERRSKIVIKASPEDVCNLVAEKLKSL